MDSSAAWVWWCDSLARRAGRVAGGRHSIRWAHLAEAPGAKLLSTTAITNVVSKWSNIECSIGRDVNILQSLYELVHSVLCVSKMPPPAKCSLGWKPISLSRCHWIIENLQFKHALLCAHYKFAYYYYNQMKSVCVCTVWIMITVVIVNHIDW